MKLTKRDREFLRSMNIAAPKRQPRQVVTAEDDAQYFARLASELTESLVAMESRYARFRAATCWLTAGLVGMAGLVVWMVAR